MPVDTIKLFNLNIKYTEEELKTAYKLKIQKIESLDLDEIEKIYFIECLGAAFTEGIKKMWENTPRSNNNSHDDYH
jgi:hypothetical protein